MYIGKKVCEYLSVFKIYLNETFGHIEVFLQDLFNEVSRSKPFPDKLFTVFRQES